MRREPSFESHQIHHQFSDLAELLKDPVTVYLIGGGALTLQELKNATKDVDLIVQDQSELHQLHAVLTDAGYTPPEDELEHAYEELDAAFILQKDRRRFDVFHNQVAGVIHLSDPMVERSEKLLDEPPLTVCMVSLEDIFLFKAVANREDDEDDMIRLAQTGLDTDIIVEEIETQLDWLQDDHFIGAMQQKLDRLSDQGYDWDIHREVEQLHARTQDAEQVRIAIDSLLEFEYSDDFPKGVPEREIQNQVGAETAASGLEWLQRLGEVHRADDDSIVKSDHP